MTENKSWNASIGGINVDSHSSAGHSHTGVGGVAFEQHHSGPMGSTTLAGMGVQVQKVVQTATISSGAVDLSRNEVTRYQMRLPVSPQLKASFRKESWGDALVKVFKKELQTGDAEFDKLVYVSTDTPERTSAFLTPEMRQAIAFTIDMGGTLEIDNELVVAVSGGSDAPGEDDRTVLIMVRGLLAFASQPNPG